MLISADKLQNVPLIDTESNERLGTIKRCVFDADNGKLIAFGININSVIPKVRYICFKEIISFEQHAVIGSGDNLCEAKELEKLDKIINQNRPIIDQKVVTKNGKNLGKVINVMIDKPTGRIVDLEVQHLFSKRIFSVKEIDHISSKHVVVKSDLAEIKNGSLAETTA